MTRRSLDRGLQRTWYGSSPLRFVLWPLSILFGAAAATRRALYRRGLLGRIDLPVPVIIVGNITVGGTGKTPVTLWLVDALRARGFKPAIVSRGYGGAGGPRPIVVNGSSSPAKAGDEAVMMALRSEVPVVVDANRADAAMKAIDEGADVIVADDGLQHYRLGRDVELVVFDGERGCGNGMLLPAGPLREPVSRLQNVTRILVQTNDFDTVGLPSYANGRGTVPFRLVASRICRLDNSSEQALGAFSGQRVHAVAGIGHPERFFGMLRDAGIDVIPHAFPDHADLNRDAIEFGDDLPVVMTEKDAVKCRAFDNGRCWSVPADVDMRVEDAGQLLDDIVQAMSRCMD